jgi:hypothetical protein
MSNTLQVLSIARNFALASGISGNAGQYKPTMLVSSIGSFTVRIGQWVQCETGARGQYLGTTASGTVVVRWQRDGKFSTRDARANKPLRQFARVYSQVK